MASWIRCSGHVFDLPDARAPQVLRDLHDVEPWTGRMDRPHGPADPRAIIWAITSPRMSAPGNEDASPRSTSSAGHQAVSAARRLVADLLAVSHPAGAVVGALAGFVADAAPASMLGSPAIGGRFHGATEPVVPRQIAWAEFWQKTPFWQCPTPPDTLPRRSAPSRNSVGGQRAHERHQTRHLKPRSGRHPLSSAERRGRRLQPRGQWRHNPVPRRRPDRIRS